MPPSRTQLAPLELVTDRWLIEALSQVSSNPQVRDAAAAWLGAYNAALSSGLSEAVAQARADAALAWLSGLPSR
jgi:hypothetical protein